MIFRFKEKEEQEILIIYLHLSCETYAFIFLLPLTSAHPQKTKTSGVDSILRYTNVNHKDIELLCLLQHSEHSYGHRISFFQDQEEKQDTNKLRQWLHKIRFAFGQKALCTVWVPKNTLYYNHKHFSEYQRYVQHSAGGLVGNSKMYCHTRF